MKYLDSMGRTAASAVGHWLSNEPPAQQAHLRIKTGYFAFNGLGALQKSIGQLVQNNLPISVVLGANEKATIKADVDALYSLMGGPRSNAKLCVVTCSGGLFHPKVIHLTRTDGSELAYVGSANLTPAGINGSNLEAGILLDSREGDSISILQEIAASIDDWFQGSPTGVTQITGPATTQKLVNDGILGLVRPPISNGTGGSGGGSSTATKMPLKPLVSFPSPPPTSASIIATGSVNTGAGTSSGSMPQAIGGLDVLVAEIGGGPRWKQANFPVNMIKSFFGVNPTANDHIELYSVSPTGIQSAPDNTQVVNVKSQNYRIELASVAGIPYPANGRPIGVFRKIGLKKFRYRIFFLGDSGYQNLVTALQAKYTGPVHHLKRIEISQLDMNLIWTSCPV